MARLQPMPSPSRRIVAVLSAGLVLALTLFAASPVAHEWLHSAEKQHTCPEHGKTQPAAPAASEPHDCAIVLFASGVDIPVAPLALTPPRLVAAGISPVTAAAVYLVSPRYLRQPERGPPAA